MQTILNLLTRDGVVYMEFTPALSGPQYTHLLELSDATGSADQLKEAIRQWAAAEGLTVSFTDTGTAPRKQQA